MGDFGDDPDSDDTEALKTLPVGVDLDALNASDPLPPLLTDEAPEPFEGGGEL